MAEARWRRSRLALAAILTAAFALRITPAAMMPSGVTEREEFIRCARSISWDHLPIREYQHPALPAYLIRISSLVFGETLLGYRTFSVLAGVGCIALIYHVGLLWWGERAAAWSAGLLAINAYHISASAEAFDLSFDLFFNALAIYGFCRFLKSERAAWLFLAALAAGLGFLCKEITCLLLPVFFVSLLLSRRHWLLRPQPWLAVLLFLGVIAPDVWCNLTTSTATQMHFYANYWDHLSRFGGIGLNYQPSLFYFRSALDLLGIPYRDDFGMRSMSLPSALILLAGVVYVTICKRQDLLAVFLLVMFWGIFLFFSLIVAKEPSRPEVRLDPVLWYWIDRTMLAAVLMAGLAIRDYTGSPRGANEVNSEGEEPREKA